jgi:hypothetical protein
MMVDDAEESQLKGPIDLLAPYNSPSTSGTTTSTGHIGAPVSRPGAGAHHRSVAPRQHRSPQRARRTHPRVPPVGRVVRATACGGS